MDETKEPTGDLSGQPLLQPAETNMSDETKKLAGSLPLKTIVNLSVGPLLSQMTAALYSIVDTVWVAHAIGEEGMAAVSTYNCFDNIGRSFGQYLGIAGSTKVSQLYGKGRHDEASQVVVDLFRCTLIVGIIIPLSLRWVLKPAARWFGASEDIVEMGYLYMLPIQVCTFTTDLFNTAGGCLQGEGRTMLFGWMSVATLIVNGAILEPVFLLWWKWGLVGASLATTAAELIGAVILVTMYFMGKFGIKPKFSQLIKPFSSHTWPALKVGLATLLAFLSQIIPSILMRKFIGMSCSSAEYNDVMAAFNVVMRLVPLTNSVMFATSQGLIPAASFAYAAKLIKRWFSLQWHSLWINTVWGTICCLLAWTIPRQLAMMFSSEKGYLDFAEPMIIASKAIDVVACARFNSQAVLQSMQKGVLAAINALITQFLSLIGFTFLLYYTNKHDPVRLMWAYSLSIGFGMVVAILFLIKPLYDVRKKMKGPEANDAMFLTEEPHHLMHLQSESIAHEPTQ